MTQGWKWAEFRYCKQAETSAPIEAHTSSPRPAATWNGQEKVRTVKSAAVRNSDARPYTESSVRSAEVTVSVERRTQPQPVNCKKVASDITIEELFQ